VCSRRVRPLVGLTIGLSGAVSRDGSARS
jgi:hypothetical protein